MRCTVATLALQQRPSRSWSKPVSLRLLFPHPASALLRFALRGSRSHPRLPTLVSYSSSTPGRCLLCPSHPALYCTLAIRADLHGLCLSRGRSRGISERERKNDRQTDRQDNGQPSHRTVVDLDPLALPRQQRERTPAVRVLLRFLFEWYGYHLWHWLKHQQQVPGNQWRWEEVSSQDARRVL